MEKYYQGEKLLDGNLQGYVGRYDHQNPNRLKEFNQDEKMKIFKDVYSCIRTFHQLVIDVDS
jgi:hypothetical protein